MTTLLKVLRERDEARARVSALEAQNTRLSGEAMAAAVARAGIVRLADHYAAMAAKPKCTDAPYCRRVAGRLRDILADWPATGAASDKSFLRNLGGES